MTFVNQHRFTVSKQEGRDRTDKLKAGGPFY